MQNDGNLVIYENTTLGTRARWASNTSSSDASLKRDVETLDGVMEKLRQLRGVSFFWRDEERGKKRQLGLIAQEVEAVFPEVVDYIDGKHRGVQYDKLVGVLIQALKEQDERIARLEERLGARGATA
jgi:hypothetical protein